MAKFDVGKFGGVECNDFLAPQHTGLQYVCLVHRADLPLPRARQLKSGTRHTADLIGSVLLGVESPALPVSERLDAPRLAEIDAAGELADDDEIDTPEHAGLERRRVRQRRSGAD